LINPLLERHLGRWAEVYFTSPPESREQAVEELLQELENETHGLGEVPELQPGAQVDRVTAQAEIVCPKCRYPNPAVQKFCGNCGSLLSANVLPAAAGAPPATASRVVQEMPSFQPVPNPAESDLQWLRGKAFSQWDEAEAPEHRERKWLAAGLGVMSLLAAFGYLHWVSRDRPTSLSPAGALVPPAVTQPALQPADSSARSAPLQQVPAALPHRAQTPKAAPPQSPSDVPDSADVAGGSQELLLAKQRLASTAGARDSATAAQLLWKAVGKQNVQAALLLSDLYVRGDGVARNCDQARLLLVAAAKKGGTAAAQQLRSLESKGCR
jgi:TPR repeat protein